MVEKKITKFKKFNTKKLVHSCEKGLLKLKKEKLGK